MKATDSITNTEDVIDSRDVIARIEHLQGEFDAWADLAVENAVVEERGEIPRPTVEDWADVDEDGGELRALLALAEEASCSPDWIHGETLIRDSYFTEYIEQLIDDCYELPKEFKSGEWPWRHMSIDFEAAADEAKADYSDCDFDGETYWIRNC